MINQDSILFLVVLLLRPNGFNSDLSAHLKRFSFQADLEGGFLLPKK
ncbi:hypothetical protein V7O59_02160 [Methanolobus sp. ZRKC1]